MSMQSLSIVKEIARRCNDPSKIKNLAIAPENQNPDPIFAFPNWGDLSFSSGYPGILLLFTELERQFPNEGWEKSVHNYVLAIKAAIEQEGLRRGQQSLFGGLAGVCFALQCASLQGKRYKSMIDKLDNFLISAVESHYLVPLRQNLNNGVPSSPMLYEMMQGIAGICAYSLQHLKNPLLEKLTRQILEVLVRLCQPINIQGCQVPGWYIQPQDFFLEEDKKSYPKGNFNLGVSHGVSSLLGILALAFSQGIVVNGNQEAMETIANWLISKRHHHNNTYFWGSTVPFEEETGVHAVQMRATRDAWCYGVPGISRMLFLAGKALGNISWQKIAVEIFGNIFLEPTEKWHIPAPTFCHGIAGLFLINSYMAKDSAVAGLQKQQELLKEMLLQQFNPDYPFGFQDLDLQRQGSLWPINKPGLLEGATGTLLSLLHPHLDHPQWQAAFLIERGSE